MADIGLPPPENLILDLGAGQGRNTFPLAKSGYKVIAVDGNKIGSIQIAERAKETGLTNIQSVNANLLDSPFPISEKVDFAFMSHVSQHLLPDELRQVLKNVAGALKQGKKFVFDALVRRNLNEISIIDGGIDVTERFGAASFTQGTIQQLAQEEGFTTISVNDFNEGTIGREKHEACWEWGGKVTQEDRLRGITKRRPVKLKWFTLLKR